MKINLVASSFFPLPSSLFLLNLAILALLEQEGIDLFYVNILSDTETYKTWQYREN
ncbi:hypothetical protein [Okeania sp. SIO1I7]|uniref:hypothetical protein n=1 Tax=Okeania sp. SIO1I7 TaxID=2607772 RepID=UPI0013F6F0D3|nr:hypothetical protein [Okeania sp. SIO1I7]NET24843.1 hypothetical protein [Okeania sp. SIO1I7]